MFGSKGDEPVACHAQEIHLLESFLSVLAVESMRGKRPGGVVLVTLLDDEGLLYLLAAMKRHGLLSRLLDQVAAATSLEVIFRHLDIAKRAFGFNFLDKHCKSIWKDPKVRIHVPY